MLQLYNIRIQTLSEHFYLVKQQHQRHDLNLSSDISKMDVLKQPMSNPNGLLSQRLCHYLDQGHTLNDILRAAHCITCFDLSKLI